MTPSRGDGPEQPDEPAAARNGSVDEEEMDRRRRSRLSAVARTEEPESEEPAEQEELFVYEQGRRVTLGTLISRGTPTKHSYVFGAKRVKARTELIAHDADVILVTRGRVSKTVLVPKRDQDENVTEVTIETHLRTYTVAAAGTEEADALLALVPESEEAASPA